MKRTRYFGVPILGILIATFGIWFYTSTENPSFKDSIALRSTYKHPFGSPVTSSAELAKIQFYDGDGRPRSLQDFKGQVVLLNIWATWCVSCRAEHDVLLELARTGKVDIYGLNYKDNRADAQRWLRQLGDPYVANAFDENGRVGIDWGVYGAPETFIMDKHGIIRHKHIGPLTREALEQEILPLIARLEAGQ